MFYQLQITRNFINTIWKIINKTRTLITQEAFGVVFIVLVSSGTILLKGSSSEGQLNLFSSFLKNYTEETAAAIISPSQNQLSDINSLAFNEDTLNKSNKKGLGVSTLQQNSLLSYNSLENDFGDFEDTTRNIIAHYTVQNGDTLSFIASDFGVSINSIIWANNLKDSDSIKPGIELKIPPVSGVIHTVKSGDTVQLIAKKYGVEPEKIVDFNSLPKDGSLQIGAEIIIPDGKIQQPRSFAGLPSTFKRFQYLPNLGDFFSMPTTGFNWGRIHGRNGVDVANSCGTPIYAAADGQITISDSAGWNKGFGKYIKIAHVNGTETIYAHATKLIAALGEYVTKGQLIALMGSTGHSTGCHLHFEVHGARNPLAKY